MVAQTIAGAVKRYLHTVNDNGVSVKFGVVFGSSVSGKCDKWSDIDLIVVSPKFDAKRKRRDIDLLWRLAPQVDSRIEPIPCGVKQWQEDDSSTIIEAARRTGKKILM
ncbi:MAG: nucleotidyltransferase domain-containing protein [Pseudomonadota bacterium]